MSSIMYGLLLQSIVDLIRSNYGQNTWRSIRHAANIDTDNFDIHTKYDEHKMSSMFTELSQITGDTIDNLTNNFGQQFVGYMPKYGYDRILRILGRHMRDFLKGLDNLHEYMRHSYPDMVAPSFIVDEESSTGCVLHYHSVRKGFTYYVKGQIEKIGLEMYKLHVKIEILSEEFDSCKNMNHIVYRLHFDNKALTLSLPSQTSIQYGSVKYLPSENIHAETLLSIFPFHILFNSDLSILSFGESIKFVLDRMNKEMYLNDYFKMIRPPLDLTWSNIIDYRENNLFELSTKLEFGKERETLRLRGQMFYIQEHQKIVFLATPLVSSLDKLSVFGFYVNDLSLYDYSRELVVVGSQQQAELKLALDQQRTKSKALAESMKKLDNEKRRADDLLHRLLPKKVAECVRDGTSLMNLCETFTQCTILFSDIVEFTSTCSHLSPIEVVTLLNEMFTRFDGCLERFNCYKVETIGDAYMIASGVPERFDRHSLETVNMGFAMLNEIDQMINPVTKESMKIRIGCHSGAVVAGIVGLKMPRYCLFGESVQIANKMEATSQIMRIHVSEKTKDLLDANKFIFKERGRLQLASSGSELKTFIVEGRHNGQEMEYPFSHVSSVEFDTKDHGAKWEGFKLELRK